ncbi:MAG: hypothetical protein OEU54_08070 [Gemmatimonadota bacterium]|nr:hypothetical protein [Gemmatimonadota bacterium]
MTSSQWRAVAVVIGALSLSGCSSEPTIRPPGAPRLAAIERLRVGSVDDPETSLTSIRAVEIGPDGRIYTLHHRERLIRIHAPEGTPLGSFGGRGEGPGELESPFRMNLIDGELRVWDTRTFRLSRFDLEGQFLGLATYRPKPFEHPYLRPPRPTWALPDMTFIGEFGLNSIPGAEEQGDSPVLRLALDGDILDTLVIRPLEGDQLNVDVGTGEPNFTGPPYGWGPIVAVSPARMELVVAERDVYPAEPRMRVTRSSVGGDTFWSREYPYDPVPVDPDHVEAVVANFARVVEQAGWTTARRAAEAYRGSMVIPEHTPPLTRVVIGRDGSIWLELADNDDTANHWLLLDSSGELHGQVSLPERFFVRYATLEEVWGMELDELDIPYLVLYTLEDE